jgi:hypothetical protein
MSRGSRSRSRMSSRNRGRTRSRGRNIRGGSGGANYSSAATYAEYVAGNANDQYARVFNQGGNFPGRESNLLIGAQGQWGTSPGTPSAQNLSLIQRAGSRARRSRKGGFLGPMINQAAVPLSILAMQQLYRRKKGGRNRTRGRM